MAAVLLRAGRHHEPQGGGHAPPEHIARLAGIYRAPTTPGSCWRPRRTAPAPGHPFSQEKLCPVLALFRGGKRGCRPSADACEILLYEGAGPHLRPSTPEDEAVVRRFAAGRARVRAFSSTRPRRSGGIGAEHGPVPCAHAWLRRGGRQLVVQQHRAARPHQRPPHGVGKRESAEPPQPEAPAQPEPDSALIARLTEEILKKLR